MMTMTATSAATPAARTSGLYTVPLGSNETLRRGVAKLQFKVTSPIALKICSVIFGHVHGTNWIWDKLVIPRALAAYRAQGITNIRFPKGNFYANTAGVLKQAPLVKVPAGFKYYARKGFDPKTGLAFVWVVVS